MKEVETLLTNLSGVVSISEIFPEKRDGIAELEKGYEAADKIGLFNLGLRMVLERDTVYAVLKSAGFRPPPGPTVLMVEDLPKNGLPHEFCLEIEERNYLVIGEELIAGSLPAEKEYLYLGDNFVFYPNRRRGRSEKKAYFLIPPISFPEMENVKDTLGIRNIISISPSTVTDDYIRKLCSFSFRNDLATILVGFDSAL